MAEKRSLDSLRGRARKSRYIGSSVGKKDSLGPYLERVSQCDSLVEDLQDEIDLSRAMTLQAVDMMRGLDGAAILPMQTLIQRALKTTADLVKIHATVQLQSRGYMSGDVVAYVINQIIHKIDDPDLLEQIREIAIPDTIDSNKLLINAEPNEAFL